MDATPSKETYSDEKAESPQCSLNTELLEPRLYQQLIFTEAREQNSLVVLPTGLGKTVIMAYLMADCLSTLFREGSRGLILIVAPSKPLVDQIRRMLLKYTRIDPHKILALTGQISPEKRQVAYGRTSCIVATPQTIENDLVKRPFNRKLIKLLLVDEAHRARGDYAYAKIADRLFSETRIVGFTATPGKDIPSIKMVINALRIQRLVYRSAEDSDVVPYVKDRIPQVFFISLGRTYHEVDEILCQMRDFLANNLRSLGYSLQNVNQRTVRALAERLEHITSQKIGAARTYAANLSRVLYLQSLLFSAGLEIIYQTLREWRERPKARMGGSNALKLFLRDPNILTIQKIARDHLQPHPKYFKLHSVLQENAKDSIDSKVIVFAHHRATVKFLAKKLHHDGIKCLPLLGQSSQQYNRGMNQKQQRQAISLFKSSKGFNVLIATQVAEEGIDVGTCDLVIFYDVVSSPLRDIQRSGRGRRRHSRVIYLISKQTPEERAFYALKEEVRKMEQSLKSIQSELDSVKSESAERETIRPPDSPLSQPHSRVNTALRQIQVLLDTQLFSKEITRYLQQNKIIVDVFKPPGETEFVIQLPYGAHVILLSAERMWNILTQSKWAKFANELQLLESPTIILEGNLDKEVNLIVLLQIQHELQINSGITVVHSPDTVVTRRFLLDLVLNDRPQKIQGSNIAIQALCLIPDIGQKKAYALLEEFDTLAKLGTANAVQIQQVAGIGEILSERIHGIFNQRAKELIET